MERNKHRFGAGWAYLILCCAHKVVRRELGVKIWWCSQQTSQYHFVESVGGEVGGFDVDINYLRGNRLTPQKEIVITGSGSKLQAVVYWDDNDYGRAVCSVNRVWGEAFFGPPKNQIENNQPSLGTVWEAVRQ